MTYEEAIHKLEVLAEQAENDKLPIDQLADKLKEAQQLLQYCQEKLTEADKEVEKLLNASKTNK